MKNIFLKLTFLMVVVVLTLSFTACSLLNIGSILDRGETTDSNTEEGGTSNTETNTGVHTDDALPEQIQGTEGLLFTILEDRTYAVRVGSATEETSIVVPNYHNGTKVTAIRGEGFKNCENLKEISIPDTVITIEASAFYGCQNLEAVIGGENVKNIGANAFNNCKKLTSITIGNGLENLGINAFRYCETLELSEYGNAYYLGNELNPYVILFKATSTTINSCEINENTKFIYDSAFEGCSYLNSIDIGDNVLQIGKSAFESCSYLQYVNIGNGVKQIGDSVFERSTSIEYNEYENGYYLGNENNPYLILVKASNITITSCSVNENTKFIHSEAFYNCMEIKSIEVSDSVTNIGWGAFFNCFSLEEIKLGSNVESIGGEAFANCIALKELIIPNSVKTMGSGMFNCSTGSIGIDMIVNIYCEALDQPIGWNINWNRTNRPVVWGYTEE